jgi:hypothetical protein
MNKLKAALLALAALEHGARQPVYQRSAPASPSKAPRPRQPQDVTMAHTLSEFLCVHWQRPAYDCPCVIAEHPIEPCGASCWHFTGGEPCQHCHNTGYIDQPETKGEHA